MMALQVRSGAFRGASRALFGGTLLSAIFVIFIGATPAEAQIADRLSWGPVFGWESPLNDMGDYLRGGPSFGLELMYEVTPRLSVGVETSFVGHDGEQSPKVNGIGERGTSRIFIGPPTQVLRGGLDAEFALLAPQNRGLQIVAGAGVGLARMISEFLYNPLDPLESGELLDLSGPNVTTHSNTALQFGGTNAAVSGLLRVAYVLSPEVSIFVEGSGYTTQIDEEKSIVFVIGNDSLEPPSTWSSVGVRFGVRKQF